jgi:hypothetical protein
MLKSKGNAFLFRISNHPIQIFVHVIFKILKPSIKTFILFYSRKHSKPWIDAWFYNISSLKSIDNVFYAMLKKLKLSQDNFLSHPRKLFETMKMHGLIILKFEISSLTNVTWYRMLNIWLYHDSVESDVSNIQPFITDFCINYSKVSSIYQDIFLSHPRKHFTTSASEESESTWESANKCHRQLMQLELAGVKFWLFFPLWFKIGLSEVLANWHA